MELDADDSMEWDADLLKIGEQWDERATTTSYKLTYAVAWC